jgi:hypothetical protein
MPRPERLSKEQCIDEGASGGNHAAGDGTSLQNTWHSILDPHSDRLELVSAIIGCGSFGRCGDWEMHGRVILVHVDSSLTKGQQKKDASEIDRSLVESVRCAHVPFPDPS